MLELIGTQNELLLESELLAAHSDPLSERPLAKTTVKILFDESHEELLESHVATWSAQNLQIPEKGKSVGDTGDAQSDSTSGTDTEAPCDSEAKASSCSKLLSWLGGTGSTAHQRTQTPWALASYSSQQTPLNGRSLDPNEINVLVFAAPVQPFQQETVKAVIHFVEEGGSLLIAHDYQSLLKCEKSRYAQRQSGDPLKELLAAFGLRMKRLLSYPPDEISTFNAHYLSAGVTKVFIREPAYLEVLNDLPERVQDSPPCIVAQLPETHQPFIVAVEVGYGRVVAIADYAMLEDSYISYGSNQTLVNNIFQWLSGQNLLDCDEAKIQPEVSKGESAQFSLRLHNPQRTRLEYLQCVLESDQGVDIVEPQKTVRSIAPYGTTRLHWTVQPQRPGQQTLRLTVDFPQSQDHQPLFFDSIAQFQCLLNSEIGLLIRNSQGEFTGEVEIDQPFEIQAVFGKSSTIQADMPTVRLEPGSPHMQVESLVSTSSHRWRINALSEGNTAVTVVVEETGQRVSLPIRVQPSPKDRIAMLERDVMGAIDAELKYRMAKFHPGFSTDVKDIPCHICTPEAFVHRLKSPPESEQLLEALQVARSESKENQPLVLYLLQNISPTFSPVHGCYIPYAPKLATHLSGKHFPYKDNLAQNFLALEETDAIHLRQNLTALILHEKYGHGFFFTQTTLGRQLAILYKHGLTRNATPLKVKAPYPRTLYYEYQTAIKALWDSAMIVNEGFATWVELAILPHCGLEIQDTAYRRKNFLFNHDDGLIQLAQESEYFAAFPPFQASRYREGCDYFQWIQTYFGKPSTLGFQCAIQALLKATDINLGIFEEAGQLKLALNPSTMVKLLLEDLDHQARADMRLRMIHSTLRKSANKILEVHTSSVSDSGKDRGIWKIIENVLSDTLGW